MYNNLTKILTARKIFLPPKKVKILFFDDVFSQEISKFFDKKLLGVLDIRLNEINIFVILYTIFFKFEKIIFQNYIKNYIHLTKCKIVLTGIDNYVFFYNLKNYFPKRKFISIQNGFRNYTFFNILKNKKKLKADYFFGFNKSFCNLFKKNISTKTFAIGSFRNNSVKIRNKNKKNSFLFVSSGNPAALKPLELAKFKIEANEFFKLDLKILKITSEFCLKNKIELIILPKFDGKKGEKEVEFYKNRLNNEKIKYFKKKISTKKNEINQIYALADKNLVTITTHSTFGLENLARLNKTIIFNNKIKSSKNIMNIFWNYNLSKKGFFWTDDNYNEKEVNRIFNNILRMKNSMWTKKIKRFTKKLMIYEDQNKPIIKLMKSILRKN